MMCLHGRSKFFPGRVPAPSRSCGWTASWPCGGASSLLTLWRVGVTSVFGRNQHRCPSTSRNRNHSPRGTGTTPLVTRRHLVVDVIVASKLRHATKLESETRRSSSLLLRTEYDACRMQNAGKRKRGSDADARRPASTYIAANGRTPRRPSTATRTRIRTQRPDKSDDRIGFL